MWQLNGTTLLGGGNVGSNPGASWKVAGTGDFNSDALSDILFQHTDGSVMTWQLSGTSVLASGTVSSSPGSAWLAMA
jgi:hypothetical protein